MATSDLSIIVGLGKSGLSLVRYLTKQGICFAVVDTRTNPPELATLRTNFPQVAVKCGELDINFLCTAKTLYVSPGLDLKMPALQIAAKKGVNLSGDIDLFSQVAKAPIIAITGSNGKSTVTTLVGEMAKTAGKKVAIGGNLGEPALNLLADDIELYVLELSSFQLESCHQLNAEVATILNVTEDHMDRYQGLADYAAAKQRVFIGAKQIVVNLDDPSSNPVSPTNGQVCWEYTTHANQPTKGFKIAHNQGKDWLALGDQLIMLLDELKIKGRHNWSNALAALALGNAVGLPLQKMKQALLNFKGLRHRCEWVAEKAAVTYFNDSKATNVGAALAAISGLGESLHGNKIVLIAGGDGKGADFSSLEKAISHYCRAVVLLGRDAPLIDKILAIDTPRVYVKGIDEAVKQAAQLAHTGDAVLLAPACASWDMFNNFEERGDLFAKAARELAV